MNKILAIYTRLFGFWVLLGFIVAYLYPQYFIPLKNFMDLFFAFTMLGIGVILNTDDLKSILLMPRIIILGVAAQYTIMPLLAFAFAKRFFLSGDFALGLILTGAARARCPAM